MYKQGLNTFKNMGSCLKREPQKRDSKMILPGKTCSSASRGAELTPKSTDNSDPINGKAGLIEIVTLPWLPVSRRPL